MSTIPLRLIDRIPGIVWFFGGMLLASLALGLLLAIAHAGIGPSDRPVHIAEQTPRAVHTAARDAPPSRSEPTSPQPEPRPAAHASTPPVLEPVSEPAQAPAPAPSTDMAPTVVPTPADPPVAPPPPDPRRDIRALLEHWTLAWSAKDMPAYLAQYHPEFSPENGLSRNEWERQRQRRIGARQGRISVALREIHIDVDGTDATAEFIQDYRAARYQDATHKRLDLRVGPEGWRIVREHALDASD